MLKRKYLYDSFIASLVFILGFSILLAVTIGSVDISPLDVYKVIIEKIFGFGNPSFASGSIHDVVWLIRLPRLVLAAGIGASLSVSGLVMQAIVINPLADPYVLGVSSGAYAGATIAILLGVGNFMGSNFIGVVAFLGAFIASLLVVFLANLGGRANSVKLILSGTAVSAIFSAFSNFIIYTTHDSNQVQQIVNWTMGSLAGANWPTNRIVIIVTFLCVLFFWSQYRSLNLMLLGNEAAITLGADLYKYRIIYLLVSALMVGFSVYSAGMIGFVGLVIPHAMRSIFGTDHKKLVPLCALIGAIFLVWIDVLCRIVIKGTELPIGILTSMIGAPCFIYLIIKYKHGFGGEET